MTDAPQAPVVVNPSSLPEVGIVIGRYAATILSGWLIRRGVMTDSDLPLIQGAIIAALTAGFAIWTTIRKKQTLVSIASNPKVPDAVAQIKQP